MARALSVNELKAKKFDSIRLSDPWHETLGLIPPTGIWFIWGQSGSGKTTFTLQLCKELCRYYKGIYNSLEEGLSLTLQRKIRNFHMEEVNSRLAFVEESMDELTARMDKRMSPHFYIIDSFQSADMSLSYFKKFHEKYKKKKLIIFISQVEGRKPAGRTAKKALFEASQKFYIDGFRAWNRGRSENDVTKKRYYDIWPERAHAYWGNQETFDMEVE